jgi:hypothetical protein
MLESNSVLALGLYKISTINAIIKMAAASIKKFFFSEKWRAALVHSRVNFALCFLKNFQSNYQGLKTRLDFDFF